MQALLSTLCTDVEEEKYRHQDRASAKYARKAVWICPEQQGVQNGSQKDGNFCVASIEDTNLAKDVGRLESS